MLEQKDAEIELNNTLVCNDQILGLIASTKEASNKNENKGASLISNSFSTSNKNVDKDICKLPILVIKELDGSVLNWQTFWDQFEPIIHSKKTLVTLINLVI